MTSTRRRSTTQLPAPAPTVGWRPALPPAAVTGPPVPTPKPLPRRRRAGDRDGKYELRVEGLPTTTRQAEVLNVALAARPVTHERPQLGQSRRTGASVGYDALLSYADRAEPNFNSTIVAILGDLGKGKSSLIKSMFVLQQLLLGRYVVVLSKKRQGTEDEYAPTARAMGTASVRLVPGGGPGSCRINIMDPRIGIGVADNADTEEGRPPGQLLLLRTALEHETGARLAPKAVESLRIGLVTAPRVATAAGKPEADVWDLMRALENPDPAVLHEEHADAYTVEQFRKWGTDVAFALRALVTGDLAGVIDGPTSPEVVLDHPSRLTVFDISSMPETGSSLPIVMLLIQTWTVALLAQRSAQQQQTVFVAEEGWWLATGGIGNMFLSIAKLSRALGLILVSGFHHPSDIPDDSPARALWKEARTMFLFGQDSDADATETLHAAGQPADLLAVLKTLPQGECILVKTGADPEHIAIQLSTLELGLTDTDLQLTRSPAHAAEDFR